MTESPRSWKDSDAVAQIAGRFPDIGHAELMTLNRELSPLVDRALVATFGPLLSANDRDEVLAEALVKVWLHKDQYHRSKGRLSSWFFRIAKNQAVDRLRARQREEAKGRAVSGRGHKGASEDLKVPVKDPELQAEVARFVGALDPQDAELLEASVAEDPEGRWAAEFAAQRGLESDYVRVRAFRLRQRLRLHLLQWLKHVEK